MNDQQSHEGDVPRPLLQGDVPRPLVPDYKGACLVNAVAALRAAPRLSAADRPPWLPAPLSEATQAVLLVLDGLGWEQLQARRYLTPTLVSGTGGPILSVVPSTTATALTSLTTGRPPAEHGVLGYRMAVGDEVLNVLRWTLSGRDARSTLPPSIVQPFPPLTGETTTGLESRPVPVVTRTEFTTTGFTGLHLRGNPVTGWRAPSELIVEVRRALAAGEPFVYAYYDGVDRVAHARGLGDHYDAELKAVDRLAAEILDVLPPGACLAVTADHGQVDVGGAIEVLSDKIMRAVRLVSGEGRFRWLHVVEGAMRDLVEVAEDLFGHVAWVVTSEQMFDEGWFGGIPSPAMASRLGDVALIPFEPIAFLDPADTGEQRLAARHGSLTRDEMMVPLLSWPAR